MLVCVCGCVFAMLRYSVDLLNYGNKWMVNYTLIKAEMRRIAVDLFEWGLTLFCLGNVNRFFLGTEKQRTHGKQQEHDATD